MMAAAIVAATELMRMSRCFTCASSWASTPSSSSFAENLQNALGRRDGRVLRVAAGREGVRRRLRDDVTARQRQAGARRQAADDAVEPMVGTDLLRAVHPQDDLVREPVRHEVRDDGEQKADDEALCAAERLADEQQAARSARPRRSAVFRTLDISLLYRRQIPACSSPAAL